MPDLFIYLIKVNVALLIFCAGYYAVLRHLTFYNLNRVYLVTAIIFSTLYPLVDFAAFLQQHEEIARPVQVVFVNWQEPVKNISKTFLGHDIWFWMLAAFWSGVILFAARLGMQLLSLYRLHKRSEPVQLHQYMIRVIEGDINPFSFWQSIYVNPKKHKLHELDAILEHEQIHVNEWHTLDILLSEISAIFYWFNPGVWLMKRAIRENIEFITDQKILMKGVDCKAYQYSLLSVNLGGESNALVNHFNISTIKKRIIMMNAKRSSKVNITRYLFLVPAVMLLLLIFSVSKAEIKKAAKTGEHMMKKLSVVVKEFVTIDDTTAKSKPADKKQRLILTADTTVKFYSFLQGRDIIKLNSYSNFSKIDTLDQLPGVPKTGQFQFTDTIRREGLDITTLMLNRAAMDTNKKVIRIKLNGDEHPVLYLNGVKSDVELKNISPDNISSVKIGKTLGADGKEAIYITTKGHEDKVVSGNVMFMDTSTRARLISKLSGMQVISDNKGIVSVSTSSRPKTIRINGKSVIADDKSITKAVINGDTIYTSNIRIVGDAVKRDSIVRNVIGFERKTRLGDVKIDSLKAITVNGYSIRTKPATASSVLNLTTVRDANVGISFKDKLVIIDGKESSEKEWKKLSLDKIDSVSNLRGAAAINKYGAKAKNGAIIIKTKK